MIRTTSLAASAMAMLLMAGTAGVASAQGTSPAMAKDGALVAPDGMTLYTFDKDAANSGKSACNGPCTALWPPLMAKAGDQPSGKYAIVTRDDGTHQWAYDGKPLYLYKADQKAGDRSGDNFKDVWHIIKP